MLINKDVQLNPSRTERRTCKSIVHINKNTAGRSSDDEENPNRAELRALLVAAAIEANKRVLKGYYYIWLNLLWRRLSLLRENGKRTLKAESTRTKYHGVGSGCFLRITCKVSVTISNSLFFFV